MKTVILLMENKNSNSNLYTIRLKCVSTSKMAHVSMEKAVSTLIAKKNLERKTKTNALRKLMIPCK